MRLCTFGRVRTFAAVWKTQIQTLEASFLLELTFTQTYIIQSGAAQVSARLLSPLRHLWQRPLTGNTESNHNNTNNNFIYVALFKTNLKTLYLLFSAQEAGRVQSVKQIKMQCNQWSASLKAV